MKLKHIFTALVACLSLAVGCEDDIERYLDEVKVSSSYVAIPAAGGSKTITVNAVDSWSFSDIPAWLTVTPASGTAGETEVTFKAEAATSTNEAMLYLNCAGASQIINVLQMTEKTELPISTCAEVNKGEDGVTYRIKGSVTSITSTTYGNMYINDGTDVVYVYGTLDANGAEKNFSSLGIEAGDIVTVEGPRKTYSGTIELVNVTVISIEKSLIKVDSVSVTSALPLEGGEFKAYLTCKGEGVTVTVPDDAKSWLSVTGIETSGTNATVTFTAAANAGGDRSTTLVFNTTSAGKAYSAQTELSQKGAIIEASVEEFLAAAEGDTQYRVTGVITAVSASSKYHNADITVATGEFSKTVLLYRAKTSEGNIEDLGLAVGDIVTVVGKRSSYNGNAQMAAGGILESYKHYAPATVAEFLAAANDSEFAVTGKIIEVAGLSGKSSCNNVNITIQDGDNSLYLYRVTTYDKSDVAALNPEVGATITVGGKRGEYKGNAQMAAGGVVLSYTAPAEEPEPDPTPDPTPGDNPYSIDLSYTLGANAYDDGVATINGVADQKVLKIGTSKKAGSITVTLPAGTKKVSFYAIAWKDNATTLTFSFATTAGTVSMEQDIAANDGATSNSPYTITVADTDKYTLDIPVELTADTPVTISTKEGAKPRAIFFGLKK